MEKSSDLSCPAIVSRACSHSSRRFFHGSLVGFAAARNWSSRSLLRHQRAVLHRQRSWSPPALGARSPIVDLALPGLAAVLEHNCVGEAGDRGPVAPSRLPALLALTLEAWAAVSSSRIRDLIRQMNNANLLWGAPRIHGELLKLGIRSARRRSPSTWCDESEGLRRLGVVSCAIRLRESPPSTCSWLCRRLLNSCT